MVSQSEQSADGVRVGLVSLGCAKNLVDSEVMMGALLESGAELTSDIDTADVVIVNTCSFIDDAKQESVDAILERDVAREGPSAGQALVVAGCLSQRYHEELPKALPEVDAFMGIDQLDKAPEIVRRAMERRRNALGGTRNVEESVAARSSDKTRSPIIESNSAIFDVTKRPNATPDFQSPRFRLTEDHFAYLKIAEGCNHPCAFCSIPRMRGSHRSRAIEDIVREAETLIADGARELNLISQDSTYYGMDLRERRTGSIASPEKFNAATEALSGDAPTLARLLRRLNEIDGEFWIRVLYTHPAHWTDELIEAMRDCEKVAKYVDIPLQHIHPLMLERMRRETSREHIERLIQRIREGVPDIAIRTTFIVGMPGETEERFQSLLEYVEGARFERLGVFTYSKEEGTPASRMEAQAHGNTKKRRQRQIMEAQARISEFLGRELVGKTLRVLIERPATAQELQGVDVRSWEHGLIRREKGSQEWSADKEYFLGRTEYDAPDIDGRVFIEAEDLELGSFADVQIIGSSTYDLIGKAL